MFEVINDKGRTNFVYFTGHSKFKMSECVKIVSSFCEWLWIQFVIILRLLSHFISHVLFKWRFYRWIMSTTLFSFDVIFIFPSQFLSQSHILVYSVVSLWILNRLKRWKCVNSYKAMHTRDIIFKTTCEKKWF